MTGRQLRYLGYQETLKIADESAQPPMREALYINRHRAGLEQLQYRSLTEAVLYDP